jgi:hypothetical protein
MGMAETSYNIRGRQIDGQELEAIRAFILANESLGRTAISRLLCEQWRWEQSNGRLKDRACRVLLLALESKGAITLPPRLRIRESFNRTRKPRFDLFEMNREEIVGKVSEFRPLPPCALIILQTIDLSAIAPKMDRRTREKRQIWHFN